MAAERNLFVIEDCAQAHGARYKGRSVGSMGDIGAWSFCQDKIMTTGGEGGMVTTRSPELWSRMWSYKDHGKSWTAVYEREHPPGFRWVHESIGTNARMLEMQAAIGRIQLGTVEAWSVTRRENAEVIESAARGLRGLRVPIRPSWARHGAYRCYLFVEPDQLVPGWDRDRIIAEVNARDVPCFSGSCSEVYLERAVAELDFSPPERLPVARELGDTSLAFLVHPTMKDEHLAKTTRVLASVLEMAT
jgi:dTDP-4-amino-4,6-dideoxygalactose transaminase